jgi:hypothetical protein
VELIGFADTASRSDIALDGKNTVAIELMAPVEDTFSAAALRRRSSSPTGISVITGSAPESAGRVAKLTDSVGNETRQVVNQDNSFRFDALIAGVYQLSIEGGYEQPGVIVDGESGMEVLFQTLTSTWEAKVSPAGSMPGFSVVRVEVEGMRGLPVYIWKEDWEGMMRRTGSKPEYGDCAAEFSPLGPGHYMIEPEGIGVWVDVELTGLEVIWIDFRRKSIPTSPNVVQPLPRQAFMPAPPAEAAPAERWNEDQASELGGGFEENVDANFVSETGVEPSPTYPQPPAARQPYYDDEPTFTDEGDEAFEVESFEPENFEEGNFHPDNPDTEPGWRSSLATSSVMDFQLPSLTRGDDDDSDADDFAGDFDEESDEDFEKRSDNVADAPAGEMPPSPTVEVPVVQGTADDAPSTTRMPITLLIPTPVTDLDDLAALVRFVSTTQSTMARTVDEVADGSRVLLIGTTGTEDWSKIEQQLASRGLLFERVKIKLSEALADDSLSGL